MSSFSPVHTIGNQIIEAILLHQQVDQREARERGDRDAAAGRHAAPEQRVDQYAYPAERRPAPARHDRDGALLRPDAC